MEIRPECAADGSAIQTVTTSAFARAPHSSGTEPRIIHALRAGGALSISLVAVEGEEVVGHIAFSPVVIGEQAGWQGLGPISVRPDRQSEGIGSALVREGLRRLKETGAGGCVLVGDPAFYRRFGFRSVPDLTYGAVPREYVLALAFSGRVPVGEVKYHAAFEAP